MQVEKASLEKHPGSFIIYMKFVIVCVRACVSFVT